MFFFIAGIQPKTVEQEGSPPRVCPSCGLQTARLMRTDHYLSVFFLPLLRVKKGTPYLLCRNCGSPWSETGQRIGDSPSPNGSACPRCGGLVEGSFRFCPFCGRPLP